MRETDDQLDILRTIKVGGGYGKKWATMYAVGAPDLICALPPIGIFLIEVKTPTGKHRPKQDFEQEQFKKAGGFVVKLRVWRKRFIRIQTWAGDYTWDPKKQIYTNLVEAIIDMRRHNGP